MHDMTSLNLPDWVSSEVFRYLEHTMAQVSIRELARAGECHPSTVMRQIRRLEHMREDPLIDGALQGLSDTFYNAAAPRKGASQKEYFCQEDAARCLTLLAQKGAVLAVGRDMPKAIVLRDAGAEVHKTVVDRGIAEVLALQDWISCFASGRVHRYRLTKDGRSALAMLMARTESHRRMRQETTTQSGVSGIVATFPARGQAAARRARYGLQETPLQTLSRLSDRGGKPFLSPEMVRAGERLREDFELAQIGQHIAREHAAFGETFCDHKPQDFDGPAREAFKRASSALYALGPGLSDIALRCCCNLEGLEAAERDLGWSARSGKIVLRIALEQLHQHYISLPPQNQMIG